MREPYINHPLEVAAFLVEYGHTDTHLLAAAILHDTVEDTTITNPDVVSAFGPRVAAIVADVTDDKSLPKDERKRRQIESAIYICPEAKLIKVADKLSNLRSLVRNPPVGWDEKRRMEYVVWARRVVCAAFPSGPITGIVTQFLNEAKQYLMEA